MMIPFRVYDRDSKQVWIVLNHHPGDANGYLLAREDDAGADGDMRLISAQDLAGFKFVDFMDDGDDYDN